MQRSWFISNWWLIEDEGGWYWCWSDGLKYVRVGEISLQNSALSLNPGLDADEDDVAIEVNDVGDGINGGVDDSINDDVNEDGKLEFTCGMRISLGISSSSLLLLDSKITKY